MMGSAYEIEQFSHLSEANILDFFNLFFNGTLLAGVAMYLFPLARTWGRKPWSQSPARWEVSFRAVVWGVGGQSRECHCAGKPSLPQREPAAKGTSAPLPRLAPLPTITKTSMKSAQAKAFLHPLLYINIPPESRFRFLTQLNFRLFLRCFLEYFYAMNGFQTTYHRW